MTFNFAQMHEKALERINQAEPATTESEELLFDLVREGDLVACRFVLESEPEEYEKFTPDEIVEEI